MIFYLIIFIFVWNIKKHNKWSVKANVRRTLYQQFSKTEYQIECWSKNCPFSSKCNFILLEETLIILFWKTNLHFHHFWGRATHIRSSCTNNQGNLFEEGSWENVINLSLQLLLFSFSSNISFCLNPYRHT